MAIVLVRTIAELRQQVQAQRAAGKRIGFVPTMGYLHEGHAALIRQAAQECEYVVTSDFVNPTQFAPNEDFERYPRDLQRDLQVAEQAGSHVLFAPSVEEIYPEGFATTVSIRGITEKFEGAFRPTHFDGVATVVSKLFNIVQPDRAYFGQKDYQQLLVIRQLVRDLNFPIEVVMVPTVREPDGLALSSRNVYLSAEERQKALSLYRALQAGQSMILQGERRRSVIEARMQEVLSAVPGLHVDYAAAALAETLEQPEAFSPGAHVVLLVAARLPSARLIDNLLVRVPNP